MECCCLYQLASVWITGVSSSLVDMPSKIAICYSIRSVFYLEHDILWMPLFLHAGGYILLLITWMHTICSNVIIKNCATKFSTVHVHLMCQLIPRLCNDNIIPVWGPVISLWSMFSLPPLTDLLHSLLWLVMQGGVYCNHFHNGLSFPWVHSQRLQHTGDYFHGNLILINGLPAPEFRLQYYTQLAPALITATAIFHTISCCVSTGTSVQNLCVCCHWCDNGFWKVMALFL